MDSINVHAPPSAQTATVHRSSTEVDAVAQSVSPVADLHQPAAPTLTATLGARPHISSRASDGVVPTTNAMSDTLMTRARPERAQTSHAEDFTDRMLRTDPASALHQRPLTSVHPSVGTKTADNASPLSTMSPSAATTLVRNNTSRRSGRPAPHSAILSASGETSVVSLSSHSHSGEEASAASSRSYLPLQSKTSLYRRQASATGSINNEALADDVYPSMAHSRDSTNLSRAKSVSSVSSVNSTSSMEAVPFRAAPLGNVRMGFGGYARSRMEATRSNKFALSSTANRIKVPSSAPPSADSDHSVDLKEASESILPSGQPSSQAAAKHRVLPKGPSDDWHYRNAPGMGSRNRPTPHTIAAVRSSHQRPSLSAAFDESRDMDEPDSEASSLLDAQRPRATIRSKLAKRAGKLGLKPLTSVQGPVSASGSSSNTNRTNNIDHTTTETPDKELDETYGANLRVPTEVLFRTPKSYLSPLAGLSPGSDFDSLRATSSVTNAPLIVTKNPPGPPGTGPPPSPGLVGLPQYTFPNPAPRISPQEQPDARGSREYIDSAVDEANEGPANERPRLLRRPGSVGSEISNVLGAVLGNGSNRSSSNLSLHRQSPRNSPALPSPALTPAQIIQMEARAGLATVPSEPSGAGPVPGEEQNGKSTADLAPLPHQRPLSNSISTQFTIRPSTPSNQRWSNGGATPKNQSGQTNPFRPGFFRALTSEGIIRRSTSSKEDLHSSEESRRGADRTLLGGSRSGSVSPRSPGSTSIMGRNSPSLLRLEVSSGLPPASLSPTEIDAAEQKQLQKASVASAQQQGDLSTAAEEESSQVGSCNAKNVGEPSPATRPAIPRINSSTTPSELPSIAATSTSNSILSNDLIHGPPAATALHPESNPGVNRSPQATASQLSSTQPDQRQRGLSGAARSARSRNDFWFGELIGEGSYSTVVEAWDVFPVREKGIKVSEQAQGDASNALAAIAGKTSQKQDPAKLAAQGAKLYAVKVLDKVHILKEKKQKYVNVEKEALSLLTRHPGVITLYWTFQDRDSLYFVLEMAPNGELLSVIKRLGSLDEMCTQFYAAQLIDTIEAIHKAGVLHRDIKPENVLLSADMRIRVADFGSAKVTRKSASENADTAQAVDGKARPSSFVGTAEYVSPELLIDKQVSEASDIWAFGCVLYQMLCGRPPFKGASEYQTFQKIMRRDFEFQSGVSEIAKDLIEKTLAISPSERPTYEQIRSHAFFSGVEWSAIWTCPTPILQAGIYKRPPMEKAASTKTRSTEKSDDEIQYATDEADEYTSSQPDSLYTNDKLAVKNGQNVYVEDDDDADDDESSLSDAQVRPSFRQRGFSAGAVATERMLSQVGASTRRGSNLISKITSGRALLPDANDGDNAKSKQMHRGVAHQDARLLDANEDGETSRVAVSPLTSWAALLLPNESLLYACPVLHRTGGGLLRNTSKKRQLLLTDFPRLLCVKETNDQLKVKSEVILSLPKALIPMAMSMVRSGSASDAGSIHTPVSSTLAGSAQDDVGSDLDSRHSASPSKMRRQSSAGPLMPTSSSSMADKMRSLNIEQQSSRLVNTGRSALRRLSSQTSDFMGGSSSSTSPAPRHLLQQHTSQSAASGSAGSGFPSLQQSSTLSSSPNTAAAAAPFVDVTQASPNLMTSIETKSTRSFVVHTPSQSYVYEDPSGDAGHWVKSITMAARRHGASLPSA